MSIDFFNPLECNIDQKKKKEIPKFGISVWRFCKTVTYKISVFLLLKMTY